MSDGIVELDFRCGRKTQDDSIGGSVSFQSLSHFAFVPHKLVVAITLKMYIKLPT